jgi:hypothetical protein
MTAMRYTSSNADQSTRTRPHCDTSLRRYVHGPIRPMVEEPNFLQRLFRLH